MIHFACLALVLGQTPYPQITHSLPAAVSCGMSGEIEVFATPGSLATARQVVFQGDGIRAEVVPPADKAKAKAVFQSATSTIDSIADKNIIHKNKAARHKSRLAAAVKALA